MDRGPDVIVHSVDNALRSLDPSPAREARGNRSKRAPLARRSGRGVRGEGMEKWGTGFNLKSITIKG